MADLAKEDLDRYLNSNTDASTPHPEDRNNTSDESDSDAASDTAERTIRARDTVDDDIDDEEDLSNTMSTLTATRSAYQLPSKISYANTGPKGVIADAQSFARARKSTFRRTLNTLTNNFSPKTSTVATRREKRGSNSTSDDDTLDHDGNSLLDDDDSDFMQQWRQTRLKELQSQSTAQDASQRRISPSRRTYGTVRPVDAEGYLNAVEHTPSITTVVVLLYDPTRTLRQSRQVEDECDLLAYKYMHVRFVKLDYGVAEMMELECPSIIGYRNGDVIGTISGVRATVSEDEDGLGSFEGELVRQGVLPSSV